jgi:hypothetical protein
MLEEDIEMTTHTVEDILHVLGTLSSEATRQEKRAGDRQHINLSYVQALYDKLIAFEAPLRNLVPKRRLPLAHGTRAFQFKWLDPCLLSSSSQVETYKLDELISDRRHVTLACSKDAGVLCSGTTSPLQNR